MLIFGFQNKFWTPLSSLKNKFWIPLAGCFRPKLILGCWESKIYFGVFPSKIYFGVFPSKIYFGVLGVQNLFWGVGSPKFILDSSNPCTFNHTRREPYTRYRLLANAIIELTTRNEVNKSCSSSLMGYAIFMT
jgi:hypothetical protein